MVFRPGTAHSPVEHDGVQIFIYRSQVFHVPELSQAYFHENLSSKLRNEAESKYTYIYTNSRRRKKTQKIADSSRLSLMFHTQCFILPWRWSHVGMVWSQIVGWAYSWSAASSSGRSWASRMLRESPMCGLAPTGCQALCGGDVWSVPSWSQWGSIVNWSCQMQLWIYSLL